MDIDIDGNILKNYDEILSNRMEVVDDKMWNILDEMDMNNINQEEDHIINTIFSKYHEKEKFEQKLFTLISLRRVQSIIDRKIVVPRFGSVVPAPTLCLTHSQLRAAYVASPDPN